VKRFFSIKAIAAMAAITVGTLGAGVAFASWTATGTGAGKATATSATDATVTAATSTEAGLWPGNATSVPVHFTVNNPNPYNVTYKTFNSAVIDSVTPSGCHADQFSLASTSGNLSADVPVTAGNSASGSTAAILNMLGTAPDACQGAVVNVTLKVAGSQD
jgi:hypothetical protein